MKWLKSFESKQLFSWYLYDWANSAYSTTVITLFLGPYLSILAKQSAVNGLVNIAGIEIPVGSLFPYSISLSVILQALILPLIGSLSDLYSNKNHLLAMFTAIGSLATLLFFFDVNYLVASLLLIISNVSFGAAIVIYNSFLNNISSVENRQKVSSNGWAFGYIGGGLLLIVNLLIFQNNVLLNISTNTAIKINIVLAGLWWIIFAMPSFYYLRFHNNSNKIKKTKILKQTFVQLKNTILDAKNHKVAVWFLVAYLFYNDGVQSVISLSSLFGQEELGLDMSFLTIIILVVQFFAAFGAIAFDKIANRIGEKKALLFSIFIWLLILLYAFFILKNAYDFFTLAIFIALVMGGIQSISRSAYSKLIPKEKEGEYFSLYEISEKGTSWMGPFLFGLTYQITHSYRYAILSLILFFIIGGTILIFTKFEKSKISHLTSNEQ
jgi:UMF1 family MFS transporter